MSIDAGPDWDGRNRSIFTKMMNPENVRCLLMNSRRYSRCGKV